MDDAQHCEPNSPLLVSRDASMDVERQRNGFRKRTVPTAVVVLMLIAVQASFGGNTILIKLAVAEKADLVVFSFLRDVGGASLLMSAAKLNGSLTWPRRQDWGTFIVLGILGVYIGQMFLTVALKYVEPLNAAVLQPSQPVLTVFLGALFGVEPLQITQRHGQLKLVGVVLAASGAIFTSYFDITTAASGVGKAPNHPDASSLALGNMLLIVQCVSGALYQLLQKHLLSSADYPPLSVAGVGYLVGGVAVGLVLPVSNLGPDSWSWLVHSPKACGTLAYAIFMTSGFNYAAQAFANKHSSPSIVTAFFPLQIVFTALFSWLLSGKRPSATECAGAAMIVCGLAAVTVGRAIQARRDGT